MAISLNLNTFKRQLNEVNNDKKTEKIMNATNNFRHLARLNSILHLFEVY